MSQIYLVDINFYICTFPPPPILCSVSIVIVINNICCTQSLIIIMANTKRRNPNAPEPTRRSARAAGKRPTASSPSQRQTRYDNKCDKHKDPPETLAIQTGTESNTQRKDFSKNSCKEDSLIEESKKRLEEAEEENRKLFEEAKRIKKFVKEARQHCLLNLEALGKPIDAPPLLLPPAPPLLPPLAFGTMPSLVPLQDAVLVARRYPEQGDQSPFLTPPKK